MTAHLHKPSRNSSLHLGRPREHDCTTLTDCVRKRPRVIPRNRRGNLAEDFGHRREIVRPWIGEHQASHAGGRCKLAGRSRSHRPEANDGNVHQSRFGPVSSRQPPERGGTPPLPLSRSTAAVIPARPSATMARRRKVTVGCSRRSCGPARMGASGNPSGSYDIPDHSPTAGRGIAQWG